MTATMPRGRGRYLTSLGILTSLLVLVVGVACAHAATGPTNLTVAGSLNVPGSSPAVQSAAAGLLAQTTGLTPGQVSTAKACPAPAPGHAACAAQALVLSSTHALVRPKVSPRASFTQVFPHTAVGIAPAAASSAAAPPTGGTPAYLQQAYDLTYLSQTAGSSDTVAIVDAYDDPTAASDLAAYRANFGLPPCTIGNGCFRKVNDNGQTSPLPAADGGWNLEESLDLDAVSALCPNCHILLVEADNNGFGPLDQGEETAAAMGAKQISNSWAGIWAGGMSGTYTFPGVATIAASGDSGYAGAGNATYPAGLPGVTAAGGTALLGPSTLAPSTRGISEVAWGGSGSSCNIWEPKPAYQTDQACAGRSYSDVSADAWPGSGLIMYDNGSWMMVGGTSLATPLVAAYEAVTGVNGSTPQWAYSDSSLLNDITSGSNGTCAANIAYICNAGRGYDGPTGAGAISGAVSTGAPGVAEASSGTTYTQSISSTGAALSAGVYPNGLPTTYYWQYGPTSAYGQQTSAASAGAGHGLVALSTNLSGLAIGASYHYRLVAQNSDGTSYGYDYTLTTTTAPPFPTVGPGLTGAPRQGQTVTATSGTWNPSGSLTYQWQRSTNGGASWSPISGATGLTYTLGAADVGARVEMKVTATNIWGTASTVTPVLGPILPGAPALTSAPAIGGIPRQGQTLSASSGSWNPTGSYAYQWLRSTDGGRTWTAITGATGPTYMLGAGNAGVLIDVWVTATNGYGSVRVSSAAVGPVLSGAPAMLNGPMANGTARQGQTLSATVGTWNPAGSYAYQWLRSTDGGQTWLNITGATGSSYLLGGADVGGRVKVRVTATNPYGTASVTSNYLGAIGAAPATARASTKIVHGRRSKAPRRAKSSRR